MLIGLQDNCVLGTCPTLMPKQGKRVLGDTGTYIYKDHNQELGGSSFAVSSNLPGVLLLACGSHLI